MKWICSVLIAVQLFSYSSAGEMDLFYSDSSTVVSYSSAGEMDLFYSDSSTVVSVCSYCCFLHHFLC